jgi:hypothetical protein
VGLVEARTAPAGEITPAPQPGERVVFYNHFLRGFALPANAFFRQFLDFYHLQPHHLSPNTVVLLSGFVTLCEGYLGILPSLELWGQLFYLKLGTWTKGEPAQCGACVAVRRGGSTGVYFPQIALTESVKMWQDTYFYVRNAFPDSDCLNLPEYQAGPPAGERDNWGQRTRPVPAAIAGILRRLQELVDLGGLIGAGRLHPPPGLPSSDPAS